MNDWHGLYAEKWNGEITPEAYAHPAKFSRGLIRKIYDHALAEGWLAPGDVVIDPFGGVSLGALDAMKAGLSWVGMELEPRFVDLGNANIQKWLSEYAPHFPGWGSARLLQGDSRELASRIAEAGVCVSSPPYAELGINSGEGPNSSGERHGKESATENACKAVGVGYGKEAANLGNLRATPAGFSAAISSPPYAEARIGSESGQEQCGRGDQYGASPGQLGAMRAAGFDAAVSSPPFMGQTPGSDKPTFEKRPDGTAFGAGRSMQSDYDDKVPYEKRGALMLNDGSYSEWVQHCNLGSITTAEQNFWSEARKIVEQVYSVLRPGGHAIWVVKAFVKDKQLVDFPGQWQALCEACGFVTLHYHRAWVVEEKGTQIDLFGDEHTRKVERKSFFRRLAEKNGSPRIDWEVVLCMEKPLFAPTQAGE